MVLPYPLAWVGQVPDPGCTWEGGVPLGPWALADPSGGPEVTLCAPLGILVCLGVTPTAWAWRLGVHGGVVAAWASL